MKVHWILIWCWIQRSFYTENGILEATALSPNPLNHRIYGNRNFKKWTVKCHQTRYSSHSHNVVTASSTKSKWFFFLYRFWSWTIHISVSNIHKTNALIRVIENYLWILGPSVVSCTSTDNELLEVSLWALFINLKVSDKKKFHMTMTCLITWLLSPCVLASTLIRCAGELDYMQTCACNRIEIATCNRNKLSHEILFCVKFWYRKMYEK